ncbi:MAG: sulfite exporter TauE/SafE family protein [Bacillota bacterium]
MKRKRGYTLAAAAVLLIFLSLLALGAAGVGAQPGAGTQLAGGALDLPGKLGEAIKTAPLGEGKGQVNLNAPKGFLGIPGAPKINLVVAFLWAVWVGWIFTTVGAFGGIMAGVGHMTVFGLGDYTKAFKQSAPAFNKLLTDCIRMANQWLVGLSSLIGTITYLRMKRLAWPLGLTLGTGSISGALLIPWLTGGKISFSQYQGWFGLVVFIIGGFLLYETTPRGQARKKQAKAAAQAFEKSVKEKGDVEGIKVTRWSFVRIEFSFFGVQFGFNPVWPFLGGFFIAALSAFLGIGGGFLYVPYLTSIVGLPMFVVAGTSAMAVFVSMLTSITSYIKLAGAAVDWVLIGTELIGIFIGSIIGPRTQKYIPEVWLKRIFVVLALYVGLGYFSKGFFGSSWVPM